MFCGNCGNELREGARFCPKCGAVTRLGRQQNQPPAEPEPAGTNTPAEPAIEEDAAPAPRQQVRQRPAAGKAKPAVRLKAMPVKPAQEEQPAQQAEPAKPVSPPPAPEPAEPPQQPAAPVQPSFLETGAARLASAVGGVKDALGGESVQCGSCGTKLKAGTKFCPECGAAVTQPPKAEPAPAPDGQNSKGTVFRALNQFDGTRAKNREEQAPQMGAAAETKSKAAPSKGRIIFFAAAGVFVVVIALLAALGGGSGERSVPGLVGTDSGEKYAPGLVETDSFYGLSTTITLDEAIGYYNEYLADANGIRNDNTFESNLQLTEYGGIVVEADSNTYYDDYNVTAYYYSAPVKPNGRTPWNITFIVDHETNYLVGVIFQLYDYNALFDKEYRAQRESEISDVVPEQIPEPFVALVYAVTGGNAEKTSEWIQQLSEQNGVLNKGVFISYRQPNAAVTSYNCFFMTEEGYKAYQEEVTAS